MTTGFVRPLPLRPIWPGFAKNSAFFACITLAAVKVPGLLRRAVRARRGACVHCGYSREGLDSLTPCPECGKPK